MKKQPTAPKKMYIVRYYGGGHDDHYVVDIFVTSNKSVAIKYVERFNMILQKWKDYYYQLNDDSDGLCIWLSDKHQSRYRRWSFLRGIAECYLDVIEVR